MHNFFKRYINPKNFCIVYNGLTGLAVLYQLMKDPQANTSEYIMDISIHALTAIMLMCEEAPDTVVSLVGSLNVYRGYDALLKATTQLPTTIPRLANYIDIFNHAFNLKEIEIAEEGRRMLQPRY